MYEASRGNDTNNYLRFCFCFFFFLRLKTSCPRIISGILYTAAYTVKNECIRSRDHRLFGTRKKRFPPTRSENSKPRDTAETPDSRRTTPVVPPLGPDVGTAIPRGR